MTQLSDHFTLEELVRSSTAEQYRLDNTPDDSVLRNLQRTALLLEMVRTALDGKPIGISSGYRSPLVNQAVGGSSSSAHCLGHAVDFVCPSFGSPYEVCRKILTSGLLFDQLIHEYGRWTHIAFDPRMRQMPLTIASARQGYLADIRPVSFA